jgi:hypothetical protein
MKTITVLIIAIALTAICLSPVAATQNNNQVAVGTVVDSHDVNQQVTNYNNQVDQNANGVIIGNGNTQTVTNDNSKYIDGSVGGSSTTINVEAAPYTYHDMLDTGTHTTSEIISLFMNDVLVVPMNGDNPVFQGQRFNITWQSGCPILVYAIDTNDKDAIRALDNSPVYDDVYSVWTYGNVHVFKTEDPTHSSRAPQYLSTQKILCLHHLINIFRSDAQSA